VSAMRPCRHCGLSTCGGSPDLKGICSRLPEGMSLETWRAIQRLPEWLQDRVRERSAIKAADGTPWEQADREAMAEEARRQGRLFDDE